MYNIHGYLAYKGNYMEKTGFTEMVERTIPVHRPCLNTELPTFRSAILSCTNLIILDKCREKNTGYNLVIALLQDCLHTCALAKPTSNLEVGSAVFPNIYISTQWCLIPLSRMTDSTLTRKHIKWVIYPCYHHHTFRSLTSLRLSPFPPTDADRLWAWADWRFCARRVRSELTSSHASGVCKHSKT